MTLYVIPASRFLNNDSGSEIKMVTVQPPVDGKTMLGTVRYLQGNVLYTSPTPEPASDYFSYTIEDQYGRNSTANVTLLMKQGEPTDPDGPPLSFQGPYIVGGLSGFTDGRPDITIDFNPAREQDIDPSFYGQDVVCLGAIMIRNGTPLTLDAAQGWTLGASHPGPAGFTLYEVRRVWKTADFVALMNWRSPVHRFAIGVGAGPTLPPPTNTWFDVQFWACTGTSTEALVKAFDITAFGSGSQTANFPNFGDGIVYETHIHALLATDTTDGSNPVLSTPTGQFFGYANNFVASNSKTWNDYGDKSDNVLNGLSFRGQDAGFSINRVFKAFYL
uniref:hypothetical protein n=1 Tax=Methylobacterium sp. B34 TaxID=95563 RepID=UPI00034821AF|nr:hypothetical protein [Methylobacterium sp. B34]